MLDNVAMMLLLRYILYLYAYKSKETIWIHAFHNEQTWLEYKEYHHLALEWVHAHANIKGEPNMTATDFVRG